MNYKRGERDGEDNNGVKYKRKE